jgi:biopolymer transport protein ExbB
MHRPQSTRRGLTRAGLALALAMLFVSGGADGGFAPGADFEVLAKPARRAIARARDWYRQTAPADRVTWGGLAACAALGLIVTLERTLRLRRRRIVPRDFTTRFLERLQEGKIDRGKALDFCELNPSPAARVALGAVRRWDRPVGDQERSVAMSCRIEADRLRRNVGTLRRIAVLAPLVGLLGSLVSAGRALANLDPNAAGAGWGPALAQALSPLTAGVALAIVALVLYDGLVGRVEKLVEGLEQLGADTVDAIAMSMPLEPRGGRTPHSVRVEIPETRARVGGRDGEFV